MPYIICSSKVMDLCSAFAHRLHLLSRGFVTQSLVDTELFVILLQKLPLKSYGSARDLIY